MGTLAILVKDTLENIQFCKKSDSSSYQECLDDLFIGFVW